MDLLRYVAFSSDPAGGNPAGVVLDRGDASDSEMLAVAAEVGYSETAFLAPDGTIRYFSPLAEVPFCGHATIATAIAHAERFGPGALHLRTHAGAVTVTTTYGGPQLQATLVSVEPRIEPLDAPVLSELLEALRWSPDELDFELPAMVAFAGAWHPIIAARTPERLAELNYDFDRLGQLMARHGWTTLNCVHRIHSTNFAARNPFPPDGVIEDPATGAAAAALGGYLRAINAVDPPARLTVHQGVHIGRPSTLTVNVPANGGIEVSGTGTRINTP